MPHESISNKPVKLTFKKIDYPNQNVIVFLRSIEYNKNEKRMVNIRMY